MLNLGKEIRLARLFNKESKRIVGVAMDHGISQPAKGGLARIRETIKAVVEAGADAVIINKGIVRNVFSEYAGSYTSIILKLVGATRTFPGRSVGIASPEEALYYGADMGSAEFIINSKYETQSFELISRLSGECERMGLPFMVHAYARGELLAKEHHLDPEQLTLAVRAAVEIGADIVKTSYSGTIDGFREILAVSPVPVVVAGGHARLGDKGFLEMIKEAITAGASGVMVGTNCWLNRNPAGMVRALIKIVHQNASVEESIKELG